MPKRRSVHFGVYNVRLLSSLDRLLRDRPRFMGELSTSINDALLAVDLNNVELVTLQSRQKQTGRETQVVILNRLRKRIHDVAKKRNCSMNQLVNSALLVFYSRGGESKFKKTAKGRRSSAHSYDSMSEAERRELHQMLAELSAMQSVSFDAEEPNGSYYEYDRNLKATVKVTPDGERTPVEKLETGFEPARGKALAQNCTRGNHNLSQQKPTLFIIVGPVGAGKTTFYEAYLKEAFPRLVPALRHQQQPFLEERRSFAVEDIHVDTQLLDQAKAAGYSTKVLFISTEDANLNVGRVLVRMSRGGQAVPVSSVIDSYRESTKNLSEVPEHADELLVYDNTAHRRSFRIVAHFVGGKLSKTAQAIPDWAAKVFGKELHAVKQHEKPGRGR